MHGETFISGTVVSTGHPGLRPKRFRTVMASRYIPYAAWRAPSGFQPLASPKTMQMKNLFKLVGRSVQNELEGQRGIHLTGR